MSSTVLLTGATGFVGRQVLRSLTERKIGVRIVVRDGKKGQFRNAGGIESVVSSPDLFSESARWWSDVCSGIDTVIHVAWYAQPGLYLQSPLNLDCLAGTLQLAEGAIQAKVRRFAGVGTCSEYDMSAGLMSVDTPLKPTTPYAAAKAAAFLALSQLLPAAGVEFAWCRLFYLYGEGEDPLRLVPYIRSRLEAGQPAELTSGNQVRDFLDVGEAGRMIVDAALGAKHGALNICSGVATTVRELAEHVADEYGARHLLRFGARPESQFDPPKVLGVRA